MYSLVVLPGLPYLQQGFTKKFYLNFFFYIFTSFRWCQCSFHVVDVHLSNIRAMMWRAHFLHFHQGSSGRSSSSICIVSCKYKGQCWFTIRAGAEVRRDDPRSTNIEVLWRWFKSHRRHISVHYCLQDLHPLCQGLSVDQLQWKVVLRR